VIKSSVLPSVTAIGTATGDVHYGAAVSSFSFVVESRAVPQSSEGRGLTLLFLSTNPVYKKSVAILARNGLGCA
jgi:hypothetical protein